MASIVSSVIDLSTVQKDGRKAVVERHTDDLGTVYRHFVLAQAADDLNAALAAYAVQLATNLNATEIARNMDDVQTNGSLATPTIRWSTVAQNLAALRVEYAGATQLEAIMIGDYLSARTDVQLQTAFSMTAGQVTTLRANKLTPAANAAATIRASAGA